MVGALVLVIIALASCKNRAGNSENSGVANVALSSDEIVDQSADILEKYWKLTSINGEAIPESAMGRVAHIIFKSEESRIIGNGGCNTFNGQYELKRGNGLSLSKIASTMMACPDMEIESKFLRTLETYDKYSIVADTLTLTSTTTGVSAKFQVAYL
jgi:Heat shock protein